MTAVETRIIKSGSGVQRVTVAGSGPLVILMHGFPELALSYRHQIEPLAEAGFTVAAPDMRGYGGSFKPADIAAYTTDDMADDMAAIASELGARRWVSVGHDWGSAIAWRCALRFPDQVAAVFSLSIPHLKASELSMAEALELGYPGRFNYIRYFQQIGAPEAELARDPRDALKCMYFALSGDAPFAEWVKVRPIDSPLLLGLAEPPPGPLSFMSDAVLDQYAEQFRRGGFFGPVSWYRNFDVNDAQARTYGDQHIRQPSGFLCGDKEIALAIVPGGLEGQRLLCDDLRYEVVLPGAGHWIQQERPAEVTATLLKFLNDVRSTL
jgi:pimeloyl-ACP methyl ester carboxylesterase